MSQNAYYPSNTPTLPAGSATAANQTTQIGLETAIAASVASLDTKQPTVGQKTMAASSPVVIASDQSTINVAVVAGSAVIGHVIVDSSALPSGAATEATLSSLNGKVVAVDTGAVVVASSALPTGAATAALQTQPGVDIGDVTVNNAAGASAVNIQDGGNSITVDGTVAISAGSDVIGHVIVDSGAINATLSAETTKVIGTVNIAAAQTIATTNAGTFLVQNNAATATATLSNVASSASSVTVLASNASRKGAMVYNDSTAVLYLKFGATASATSYVVQIPSLGYYELPAAQYLYTGIIDGIWASANGNARVTELS